MEVHLIPVERQRVEVRRLQALKDELATVSRASGLVSQAGAIESESSGELAYVRSSDRRMVGDAGLAVWRDGALGGWFSLPADGLGAVLDVDDVTPRVEQLLAVLIGLNVPISDRYAIAVGMTNAIMLTIGSASVIGKRTSASMNFGKDTITVTADDSIGLEALRAATGSVAEELVARLTARLGAR